MTDKTPKKTAETPVNTPAALAGTTDTARDSEPKSRTLPQAAALKARFQAGCIPLQTDFADLIDLANIGRQAVGDEGTGLGLTKDGKNRLRFDPSKIANLTFDLSPSKKNEQIVLNNLFSGNVDIHEQVAFLALIDSIGPTVATNTKVGNSTVYTLNAVKINSDGVRSYQEVKIIADKSVGRGSGLLPFEYVKNARSRYSLWYRFTLDTTNDDFSNSTLVIDPLTLLVKHITDYSALPLDGEIISLLTVRFVYHGVIIGDGLQKDNTKISAKVDGSKGLQVNSSGIGVNSGNGIAVNSSGVNVKLAKGASDNGGGGQGEDAFTSFGSAGGLALSSKGLSVDAGNGIQIDEKGVSIKLAVNSGLSADEKNGLGMIANANAGIQINERGVGLNDDAWIKIMCDFYRADFYVKEIGVIVFFCNTTSDKVKGCVAYVCGRGGKYMTSNADVIRLNSLRPANLMAMNGVWSNSQATCMLSWSGFHVKEGDQFKFEVVSFSKEGELFNVSLKLVPAP